MNRATRRQLSGLLLVGGCVAVAALLVSPGEVLARLQHLATHPVRFVALLALAYLLRPLFAWPVSGFSVLVGYVWGIEALPLALAGATLTCLPPYALARYARSDAGLLGAAAAHGERLVAVAGDTRAVLAGRLAPIPADMLSYGAGVSGVALGPYVLGTLLGEVPWTVAAVVLGSSLDSLTLAGADPLPLVAGAAALAVLVLAGPLYRHLADPEF
jgi:uncharacterized membrane protein YdjX (TVP38/TMEM64 family)